MSVKEIITARCESVSLSFNGLDNKPLSIRAYIFTDMKFIKLTKGLFAQVDDFDYIFLSKYKWYAQKADSGNSYYARSAKKGLMHRFIMQTPKNMQVDHKDGNGLNCQRDNMRNCFRPQNLWNRRKNKNSRSIYKGISFAGKNHSIIRAVIRANNKRIVLGNYPSEEAAARAYDEAAKKLHGEFAKLNFK